MAFLALSRILYRALYLVQLQFLFFVESYRMQLVSCILQLAVWAESLVDLPLCKNAAWSNQDQQQFYAIWSPECKQFGQYVEKRFDNTMISVDRFYGFTVFHTPILAATTHAAAIKAQFIAECNKHAGVLQKIAPKNNFSITIHTQFGKANWPGRAQSRPVQWHFYPSTEGYSVGGVQLPLHTTVKIAEWLLQFSSPWKWHQIWYGKHAAFRINTCDRMLMFKNHHTRLTQGQQKIHETSILWYVLICYMVKEQMNRKAEFLLPV